MAVQQVNFQSLIYGLANSAGLNADPTQGPVSPLVNIQQFAQFLNDAVLYCWLPDAARPEESWPPTVYGANVNVSAGGVVAYAGQPPNGILESDWWRFASEDPRPWAARPQNGGSAFPIADTSDSSGIYPAIAASSTIFAFFRPLRPQFGYNNPVASQAYPYGSLLYDPEIYLVGTTQSGGSASTILMASTTGLYVGMAVYGLGIPMNTQISSITPNTSVGITNPATEVITDQFLFGTGNGYRCILDGALGNTILNTTNWQPQLVPDILVKPILMRAEGYRLKSRGYDPEETFKEADILLEEEKARALPSNGSIPPWAFDIYG